MNLHIPSTPYHYLSLEDRNQDGNEKSVIKFDLSSLGDEIMKIEENKRQAYDLGNNIRVSILEARSYFESNDIHNSPMDDLDSLIYQVIERNKENETIDKPVGSVIRDANLSFRLQEYAQLISYIEFIKKGTLIPPPPSIVHPLLSYLTDEEYLAGAVLSFLSQDLERYAVGRATVRDVRSITLARSLARQAEEILGKFDFRNGNLRRLYDGVKYSVKTLETLLYELSVTDNSNSKSIVKKQKYDNDEMIPRDELEKMRLRIEQRDEQREMIIKKCRETQKLAKRAIYALHRRDTDPSHNKGRIQAEKLLQECETIIRQELLVISRNEPSLRIMACYNAFMEEYVEARLFYSWNYQPYGMQDTDHEHCETAFAGNLLCLSDFDIKPNIDEYLGGLCDFTGEVGRMAVRRGTERDIMGVQFCLKTNRSVLSALECLPRFPSSGGVHKKITPLRKNVEKIERMLYELSIMKSMGRSKTHFLVESIKNGEEESEDIEFVDERVY